MPAPISMDLRLRIVGTVERGSSTRQAARRFAVSPSAAIKLMQRCARPAVPRRRATAEAAGACSTPNEATCAPVVEADADLTPAELQSN